MITPEQFNQYCSFVTEQVGDAQVARSLFSMVGRLASTVAKLKRCQQTPMPGTATTIVEMTCLQGLGDLERLEGPWLDGLATGDPEVAATTVRLLLAHMTWNSKRLLGAMVLDRLDAVVVNAG